MKRIPLLLVIVLAPSLLLAQDAPTGSLTGIVRFLGEVPPPMKIQTTDGGMILHSDLVVNAKTKGLRHVVAQLENIPAQAKPEKMPPVLVDQRDMVFLPRVVAVREGQTIRFENNDLCNHCVQATSIVEGNSFNVVTPPSQPFEVKFKGQKRPVPIGCPIHPWMRAWVFVVPHPYFAVSDAAGQLRIDRIPAGKHTLLLTHPDTWLQERRTVEVVAGKTTQVSVDWQTVKK